MLNIDFYLKRLVCHPSAAAQEERSTYPIPTPLATPFRLTTSVCESVYCNCCWGGLWALVLLGNSGGEKLLSDAENLTTISS
jgi:hypothetical protein